MPELPEVETVARELRPALAGRRIVSVRALWPRSLDEDQPGAISRAVAGALVSAVERRGKYLLLRLEGGRLLSVHLRMTGKLLFTLPRESEKHLRAVLEFDAGVTLYFVDPRKFGRIRLWDDASGLDEKLGAEPLAARAVAGALAGIQTARPIKAVLLDQRVLAGVGNIYADEALFEARVHPLTPARRLNSDQRARLATALPRVLKRSIRNMGTTLSDYRRTGNVAGENQHYLKVYGQQGRPCQRCATLVVKIRIGQRSAHFCPRCQGHGPVPPPRPAGTGRSGTKVIR